MRASRFKKAVCILCSIMVVCGASVNIHAVQATQSSEEYSLRFAILNYANAKLHLNGSITTSSCTVSARKSEGYIDVHMELQQDSSMIKSWDATNDLNGKPWTITKDWAVKKGHDYQVYALVTVYDEYDNIIDQTECYSVSLSY